MPLTQQQLNAPNVIGAVSRLELHVCPPNESVAYDCARRLVFE